MHHKEFENRFYDLPRMRKVPLKNKGRYVKYRPKTLQDWEQLED